MKYYMVDWLVAALVFGSILLTAHKNRLGFLMGFLAGLAGVGFSCMIESWANGVCSFVAAGLNLWGWRKWRKEKYEKV